MTLTLFHFQRDGVHRPEGVGEIGSGGWPCGSQNCHRGAGAGLPAVDAGEQRERKSLVALVVAVAALVVALVANQAGREGWSFSSCQHRRRAAVAMLFLTLFPNVVPSR
ncbi:hypothetical protein SFUMM280S_01009 [Streptomyces fumanus]